MKVKLAIGNPKPVSCLIAVLATGGFLGDIAAPAVTPDQVSGLVFWLKGDAGITRAEGKVSAWADQSPGQNNAIQSTPERQPTYVPDVLNGKPAIRFDALGGAGNPDSPALLDKLLDDKVHPNAAGYAIFRANIKAPLEAVAKRVASHSRPTPDSTAMP